MCSCLDSTKGDREFGFLVSRFCCMHSCFLLLLLSQQRKTTECMQTEAKPQTPQFTVCAAAAAAAAAAALSCVLVFLLCPEQQLYAETKTFKYNLMHSRYCCSCCCSCCYCCCCCCSSLPES